MKMKNNIIFFKHIIDYNVFMGHSYMLNPETFQSCVALKNIGLYTGYTFKNIIMHTIIASHPF